MNATLLELDRENWFGYDKNYCLFLDIDGTLAPFELDPSHSKIPIKTVMLLKQLQALNLPLAVVTGRSLHEARQLLQGLDIPIGATHGLEIVFSSKQIPKIEPSIPTDLALIIKQIEQQITAQHLSNFLLEKKPYSVALHYRQNPDLAQCVENLMQRVARHFANWQVKQGKFVWEILPNGADKGEAVTAILEQFKLDKSVAHCPIFIGDDISDEAGFLAVQDRGGIGIKVGKPIEYPSIAQFFVPTMGDVTLILEHMLQREIYRVG